MVSAIPSYGRYHRPIVRPRLFWLNRDSQFSREIEMKLSQMCRNAFDRDDDRDAVVPTRHERIRSGELPARGQKHCPGPRRLGVGLQFLV
jgi:hypothetical protein